MPGRQADTGAVAGEPGVDLRIGAHQFEEPVAVVLADTGKGILVLRGDPGRRTNNPFTRLPLETLCRGKPGESRQQQEADTLFEAHDYPLLDDVLSAGS